LDVEKLVAWFKARSITSHAIAAFFVAAAGLVTEDQQVRSLLVGVFSAHPKLVGEIIAVAGIILRYSNPSSPAGAVVAGKAALDSPSAPTASQVEAADPKTK
jgi:hypothetical protein